MRRDLEKHLEHMKSGLPPRPDSGYFGLEYLSDEARLSLVSMPWDVTTSYSDGTSAAPEAIRKASHQLDLECPIFGATFLKGIATATSITHENHAALRKEAEEAISFLENDQSDQANPLLEKVNAASAEMTEKLFNASVEKMNQGQIIGLIGGDHSCPLGLIRAIDERGDEFSILHIDAHHDLRESYEGFHESHASIMNNVLETCPKVDRLVSVGIRDFSFDEKKFAFDDKRVYTFYDHQMQSRLLNGEYCSDIIDQIISSLSQNVYISCDIDGFSPDLCPGTGTPVPGGLSFSQWQLMLKKLVESKRKVIGFDLCEVGSDEWDANVGARVLYLLCGAVAKSQQWAKL